MRGGSNRNRREHDASHGEKRNRAQIELELTPTHQEGRVVDEGGQYQEQDKLRSKLYRWQARHKRDQDASEHQKYGWWDPESVRNDGCCRNDSQQQDEHLDCCNHWRTKSQELGDRTKSGEDLRKEGCIDVGCKLSLVLPKEAVSSIRINPVLSKR